MKTQEFFAKECFTEDVANADKLVMLKSSKLKYDRVLGHIFNSDHIKVANLIMVGCAAPFETEDLEVFEKLADKITLEIKNDRYFTAYGRAYHEAIINKLLDGVITDPLIYTPHVQILYDGLDDYLYVAVVDVTQNDVYQNRLTYFKDLLESTYRSFKYAIYSNYIVMIMSSKHKVFHEEQFFDACNNPFIQNNLLVGISSNFESLYELREHYETAVATLKKGMECSNIQRVFFNERM